MIPFLKHEQDGPHAVGPNAHPVRPTAAIDVEKRCNACRPLPSGKALITQHILTNIRNQLPYIPTMFWPGCLAAQVAAECDAILRTESGGYAALMRRPMTWTGSYCSFRIGARVGIILGTRGRNPGNPGTDRTFPANPPNLASSFPPVKSSTSPLIPPTNT